jgi:RNA polymerase sigma factor (sigma-70 family)
MTMQTLWQVFQHKTSHQPDAELLSAFLKQKSQAAFAQLVERHGGMVLGLCQRMLGHTQDAEDAFQATFLVLAQKASTLHHAGPLGPWLYGVARRVAMKARSRRLQVHLLAEEHLEALQEGDAMTVNDWSELRPLIDEEISGLPDVYRSAFILCHLQGMSKAEAARQLGCPEGTVSSRLMRAKELLQKNLTQRGVTLASISLLVPALAPATVSASLAEATITLGMQAALGATLTSATSASVLQLAQGASQAMFMTKLKLTALGLVVAASLASGSGYVAGYWGQGKASGDKAAAAPKVTAATKKNNTEGNDSYTTIFSSSIEARSKLKVPSENWKKVTEQELPLEEYLRFMEKELGLVTIIDASAYRDFGNDLKSNEFRSQQLSLPRMTNQPIGVVVQTLLEGIRVNNQLVPSTFLVRRGTLVIVPKDYLQTAASRIQVSYSSDGKETTLEEALQTLSDDSGISIILDNRMLDKARDCKVKVNFRNLKLISAVKLLGNAPLLSGLSEAHIVSCCI